MNRSIRSKGNCGGGSRVAFKRALLTLDLASPAWGGHLTSPDICERLVPLMGSRPGAARMSELDIRAETVCLRERTGRAQSRSRSHKIGPCVDTFVVIS